MADEPERVAMTSVSPPPPGFFARVLAWWKAMRKRLSDHFAEYGAVAVVVYFGIFFTTWIGFTIAIRSGISIEGAAGETGSIGAAYVATKLTQPLRVLATLAITPFAAMLWHRVRGTKPAIAEAAAPAALDASAPSQPEPPER